MRFLRRSPQQAPASSRTAQTPIRPVGVLVVEDHPDVRDLICRMIERAGRGLFVAGQAADADEAVALAAREHPDIVVVDYLLPRTDGLALAARLRAGGHEGRIVLCTGYAVEILEQREEFGAVDLVIAKDRLPRLGPVLRQLSAEANA